MMEPIIHVDEARKMYEDNLKLKFNKIVKDLLDDITTRLHHITSAECKKVIIQYFLPYGFLRDEFFADERVKNILEELESKGWVVKNDKSDKHEFPLKDYEVYIWPRYPCYHAVELG